MVQIKASPWDEAENRLAHGRGGPMHKSVLTYDECRRRLIGMAYSRGVCTATQNVDPSEFVSLMPERVGKWGDDRVASYLIWFVRGSALWWLRRTGSPIVIKDHQLKGLRALRDGNRVGFVFHCLTGRLDDPNGKYMKQAKAAGSRRMGMY